jgi:energy-coupling factor transporter ATP-binding protein EcfA2
MAQFKIAVCGPHGSGKTTLAKTICRLAKSELPQVTWATIGDVARDCPFPIGEFTCEEAQRWILDERNRLETSSQGFLVSDGCMLNDCAYYWHWAGRLPENYNEAIKLASMFDMVIRLPADARLCTSDGVRPTSIEFLNNIDALMDWLFMPFTNIYRLPQHDLLSREVFIHDEVMTLVRNRLHN